MRLNKTILYGCLILSLMLVAIGHCQPSGIPQTGVIEDVTKQALSILLDNGSSRIIANNDSFLCVRSQPVTLQDLKIGDKVRVMGFSENQAIRAKIIIIEATGAPGTNNQFTEIRNRDVHVGTVTETTPLTIISNSGSTLALETLRHTMVLNEVPIDISSMTTGERVRLLPRKIIILPQGGKPNQTARRFATTPHRQSQRRPSVPSSKPNQVGKTSPDHTQASSTLLPDITQQSLSPSFIYGAWVGRGLYSKTELDRTFHLAANLGIRYLKVEFKWHYVEPSNNNWEWQNDDFLNVEHVISLARQYDFSIIPYFNIFMPWGQRRQISPLKEECDGPRSMRGQHIAPDPNEYAEYVFSVVDKLKKGGVHIKYAELDNEVSAMIDNARSWNCFIDITPKQLKQIENLAYDRIKASYPEILVSSTTFNSPGLSLEAPPEVVDKFTRRLNSFVAAYFMDSPKPKFDYMGVHEIFHGSGNPYTTVNNQDKDGGYNFSSYHETYDIWRNILDRYGYVDIPIFVTESQVIHHGLQDVELLQKVVLARSKADHNKIRGWILSQLTGSKNFTEGGHNNKANTSMGQQEIINTTPGIAGNKSRPNTIGPQSKKGRISVGIADLTAGYRMREGYYAFNTMMTTLAKYPDYNKNIMGQLNSDLPWVEQFSDINKNLLYVAFIPWDMHREAQKATITLAVGTNKDVLITRSDGLKSTHASDNEGNLSLEVTQHPVFIEVPGQTL